MSVLLEDILLGEYKVKQSDNVATYTLSMSLSAFLGLSAFLFFSPSWLWAALLAGALLYNNELAARISGVFKSLGIHRKSSAHLPTDKGYDPSDDDDGGIATQPEAASVEQSEEESEPVDSGFEAGTNTPEETTQSYLSAPEAPASPVTHFSI